MRGEAVYIGPMETHSSNRARPRGRLSAEDLQDRLIVFGADVCVSMNSAPKDFGTTHQVHQVIRSGTGVAANYSEARSAPTPRDFLYKLHSCLKELRETMVWLKILQRNNKPNKAWQALQSECDELTAIFVASIQTKKRNNESEPE